MYTTTRGSMGSYGLMYTTAAQYTPLGVEKHTPPLGPIFLGLVRFLRRRRPDAAKEAKTGSRKRLGRRDASMKNHWRQRPGSETNAICKCGRHMPGAANSIGNLGAKLEAKAGHKC